MLFFLSTRHLCARQHSADVRKYYRSFVREKRRGPQQQWLYSNLFSLSLSPRDRCISILHTQHFSFLLWPLFFWGGAAPTGPSSSPTDPDVDSRQFLKYQSPSLPAFCLFSPNSNLLPCSFSSRPPGRPSHFLSLGWGPRVKRDSRYNSGSDDDDLISRYFLVGNAKVITEKNRWIYIIQPHRLIIARIKAILVLCVSSRWRGLSRSSQLR